MTETESAAVLEPEKETPPPPAAPSPPPLNPYLLETLLRRLEEQSALRTSLARKRLFWGRLSGLFTGVIAAAVVFAVVTVLPQVETVLSNANSTLGSITQLSQQLQDADIPAILDNLDQTLTEGRASLADASEAVQSVSSIDFASLNAAILDLKRVLENPLGSLFGRG